MNRTLLIEAALKAREFAYAPYSKFQVGSAVLGVSGEIYTGCNIENSSYSATNCGERTAMFHGISQGEREFKSIAIVGGYEKIPEGFCAPCGVCRQVMSEFCNPETFQVILAISPEDYQIYLLKDLLPLIDPPTGEAGSSFLKNK